LLRGLSMFTSAFLAIKPSTAHTYAIDLALALAKRQGWHLSACTVIDEAYLAPPEAVPIGGGTFKAAKDEEAIRRAREVADEVVNSCAARCVQNGISCQAIIAEGDISTVIAQHAAEHDLLIVGHGGGDDTGDESLLRRLLKHCPRPALILPKQSQGGEDVLVAYDGSYQAARSLASFAHSGLAAGRNVDVVTCHTDEERAQQIAAVACRFFERHGIHATAFAKQCTRSPADAILRHASQNSSGLLVMGAIGKNAVHEFFFGSVTRSVLRTLPIPVFLDH
jgi:nucleotide-binding universal stress UspA family protein